MARTMPAYRLVEWQRPPELVEVPVPTPGPGEVVVAVAGNGLCHSDLAMAEIPEEIGIALGWSMPFTLGHEVGGRVAEVGDGVSGLLADDAVALVSPHSCGRCWACTSGLDSACAYGLAGRGYGRDGGLAPYVRVDSTRSLLPLGSLDPVVAGPLTDAGATAYHAVKRVVPGLVPGSTAVVVGAGGLGAFAVQHLRAMSPALVVAVDTNPARLSYATELGAHEALADLREVRSAHPDGADAVLDFVGVDDTIAAGLWTVRPGGAYGLVGAAGGTLRRPWFGTLPKEADIFTFQGSTIADAREVIALAEAGLIRSDIDRFALADVADAYQHLDRGELRGRAVVTPSA